MIWWMGWLLQTDGLQCQGPARVLCVEMKCVVGHHGWLERRRYWLLHKLLPVNGGEEGVRLQGEIYFDNIAWKYFSKAFSTLMSSIPLGPDPSLLVGFLLKRARSSDWASGLRKVGIPSLAWVRNSFKFLINSYASLSREITITEGQDIHLEDLVHCLFAVLALEWQPSGQHLVHQHPKTPPVLINLKLWGRKIDQFKV